MHDDRTALALALEATTGLEAHAAALLLIAGAILLAALWQLVSPSACARRRAARRARRQLELDELRELQRIIDARRSRSVAL